MDSVVVIRNTQRKFIIDISAVRREVEHILLQLKYEGYAVGIWFCSNDMIHRYNAEYRHKNKPTDILSFPMHTELKAGERIKAEFSEEENLGDIIIAPQYVYDDLPRWKKSLNERLRILIVHGICHLLGYDHIEETDYKVMHALETKLLKSLHAQFGTSQLIAKQV